MKEMYFSCCYHGYYFIFFIEVADQRIFHFRFLLWFLSVDCCAFYADFDMKWFYGVYFVMIMSEILMFLA